MVVLPVTVQFNDYLSISTELCVTMEMVQGEISKIMVANKLGITYFKYVVNVQKY